ncbi:MAG: RrF2 family transcriptional regulator [Planctomycetota bacterium]|jgi:Rrf2 family protein
MKLSTRARYGIRAMLELAQNEGKGPMQIKRIGQHQEISVKYLEQLLAILKSGGFVRSIRGAKGGYMLAEAADKIRLSNVFNCLEGPLITTECLEDDEYCHRAADCVTRELWADVQNAVKDVLDSFTLQDLVDKAKDKKNMDYQI